MTGAYPMYSKPMAQNLALKLCSQITSQPSTLACSTTAHVPFAGNIQVLLDMPITNLDLEGCKGLEGEWGAVKIHSRLMLLQAITQAITHD